MENELVQSSHTFGLLVELLENDLSILTIEYTRTVKVMGKSNFKFNLYKESLKILLEKLQSLWILSRSAAKNDTTVRDFANQVFTCWNESFKHVTERHSRIKMPSSTLPGVPLSVLISNIKKQANSVRMSLEIGQVLYEHEYVQKGFSLHEKIICMVRKLQLVDKKLQQLLSINKLMPVIGEFKSLIDKFALTTSLLPANDKVKQDLSAFPVVSQLLTGELLAQDPITISPEQILLENAKQPKIFITRNPIKRQRLVPAAFKVPAKRNSLQLLKL